MDGNDLDELVRVFATMRTDLVQHVYVTQWARTFFNGFPDTDHGHAAVVNLIAALAEARYAAQQVVGVLSDELKARR